MAVLVLMATAVPVIADPSGSGSPDEDQTPQPEQSVPSPASIAAAHQIYVREEEERRSELEEPPFVEQRENSQHAYEGDTPAEAEALLRSTFGATLDRLNEEPARFLSAARLDKNLGHGSAVVTTDGRTEILEAGQPVETENSGGEVKKVDLSLEKAPEGFEPENPLVETVIGSVAEDGVEVGEEGLALTQVGAEDSNGRLLGDKNVFFGEVESGSDTDLMVSPTSRGVELFDMLRSIDSPETLRFHLELPEGDSLRLVKENGIEILDPEGSIAGIVGKPHAEDAQGTEVPVELQLEGDTVVLRTHHREEDLAYPILVDPEVEVTQNWEAWWLNANLQGLGAWWQPNSFGSPIAAHFTKGTVWGGQWAGMSGLFESFENGQIPAGTTGVWVLNSPTSGSYIANVGGYPFWRNQGEGPGCENWWDPYDFEGLYDNSPGQNLWTDLQFNQAWTTQNISLPSWGHQLIFGLSSGGVYQGCWRDLMLGGVHFTLGDWQPPVMQAVSSSAPYRWINGSTPFSVYADATDGGLGVTEFFINPGAEVGGKSKLIGCLGNYESPCPSNAGREYWFVGSEFAQGEREVVVTARSPSNRNSNAMSFTLNVDLERPVVHISGQLASAIQEAGPSEAQGKGGPELTQPVYSLKVEATDGTEGTTEGKRKQSGVKTVEVIVTDSSGTKVESAKAFPNTNPTCSQGSCAEGPNGQGVTYPIPMTGLTAGKHHLRVKAWDFAGNSPAELEREFEYFPATGLTEEDVTQRFLLPDGKNHGEGPYLGPELAVNVMNGNVVYHQRDVEVDGPRANLEVELFYNSQLPKEQSSEFGTGWTLSQTPTLKSSGSTATAVTSESELAGNVSLPREVGEEQFSAKLGAVIAKVGAAITKEPGGGYSVSEEGGEGLATIYNAQGRAVEEQATPTAGIEYSYAGEHLSEIAVDDPGTTTTPPPAKKAASIVPNFVTSFGSAGTGSGQFSHPADVALDSKGDEWVVDSANNRIEEFTPGGDFIKTLGAAGTGNGQFTSPKALAFDAAGNLWVVDSGNNRLEQFGPTGTFVKAVGTKGSGNGQFSAPEGVAIAPGGHIFVSDSGNHRIVELNAGGEFIKVLSPTGLGAIRPAGIDASPEGKIWVADSEHNRIAELGAAGELIRQVGSLGSGEGQFNAPTAVAVGVLGEVWVGDPGNARVQEFTKEGAFVTQFGAPGSGAGQFTLSPPMGIATDNEGSLFVTDTNDNRVEHWQVPHFGYKPVYAGFFGTTGTGQGQFRHPGDLALDSRGDLWVPDVENNRLQEFNSKGAFIRQLGASGTGSGQFSAPKAIAFANDGEFWVADSGNSRLEEFAENGSFIRSVGSQGSGNGQFNRPEALAIAPNGHIWVADTYNHRILELDENGSFLRVINPSGLGAIEPTGIAFGPGGNAWIADWAGNRVVELNPAGELVRQVGASGAANGQFNHPDTVAIDGRGLVYVIDQSNGRVQVFNQAGEYLSQFGAAGSGSGQFNFGYPTGIAADNRGDLWIADSQNNRIQRWQTGSWVPIEEEAIPTDDDQSVNVTTSAGLVTSVSGVEAGSHHYVHSGQLLTSDEGPDGKTTYQYASERLTKVILSNGTTAVVKYDEFGRATEVVLDPAGSAPPTVTKFRYFQEIPAGVAATHNVPVGSREVEVEPEGVRRTFYAIDAAGDVVKSWNVETGPTIVRESGTFVSRKEKELEAQETQELFIKGSAPEGIKAIKFVANGSTIVDEKICTGTAAECENLELQWIVEPGDLAPGTMWIEVVLEGRVEEKKTAERWWVTVPYVPPEPAGVPQPPKYKEVLEFREERGLDLDLNPIADELELHERVRETIGAWHDPESLAGQVAYATWERWGTPLRYADEQELEYRLAYIQQDIPLVEEWAQAHAWNLYGGYWVDERAGGLFRVGFTENQTALVAQMKAELGTRLAAPDRITTFVTPPTWTVAQTEANAASVSAYWTSNPAMAENVSAVRFNPQTNMVTVEAANVAAAEAQVTSAIGSLSHIEFIYQPEGVVELSGRFRASGPLKAGDAALGVLPSGGEVLCSMNYGAAERQPPGQATKKFLLIAGHCFPTGTIVKRAVSLVTPVKSWVTVGKVVRDALPRTPMKGETDAEAIALTGSLAPPTEIYSVGPVKPPANPSEWRPGEELCFSGVKTQVSCGFSVGSAQYSFQSSPGGGHTGAMLGIQIDHIRYHHGDSGSPVYNNATGRAVGIVSGASGAEGSLHAHVIVTPLEPLGTNVNGVPAQGALAALGGAAKLSVYPYP